MFAPTRDLSLEEFMPAKRREDGRMKLEIADWSRVPDNQLLQAEMRQVLGRAIGDIPGQYRSVFCFAVQKSCQRRKAQILDVSEDVVKTRLHRAHLALRKVLDEHLLAGAAKSGVGGA